MTITVTLSAPNGGRIPPPTNKTDPDRHSTTVTALALGRDRPGVALGAMWRKQLRVGVYRVFTGMLVFGFGFPVLGMVSKSV